MNELVKNLFSVSDSIRYVAQYNGNQLTSRQRENIEDTSGVESDKYEELFVNPTILKIAGQRGRLDCGGLDFIIIKYGNFFQMIRDFDNGHLSICMERKCDPFDVATRIQVYLARQTII